MNATTQTTAITTADQINAISRVTGCRPQEVTHQYGHRCTARGEVFTTSTTLREVVGEWTHLGTSSGIMVWISDN